MALFLLENRDFLDFRMIFKVPPLHSKFWMRQWKEWNMLWFILQLIHFMAIKNLQIIVIDNVVNFLLLNIKD
jgi:hypothetical protein